MPNIVIVGGGAAGIAVAQNLEKARPALPKDWKVVVVDRRNYYWHLPAGLRAPLDDETRTQATIPFDKVFKAESPASITMAEVTKIDESSVYLNADGRESTLDYAFLVIATGQTWSKELNLPEAREEALQKLKKQGEQIEAAKDIIVVGGGSAGIELAGEIAQKYGRSKHVTLVHHGRKLLNDIYPDKLRDRLQSQLVQLGVTTKTGVSIELGADAGEVTLSDGSKINTDLVFETIGGSPNCELIKAFDPSALSSKGYITVTKTFQFPQHPRLFALGDIADLNEQKQVAKVPGHASIVAANLLFLSRGSKSAKEYKGQRELIIVTVGKIGGAGWLFGLNVGARVSSMIKSKGLFISQVRSQLGY